MGPNALSVPDIKNGLTGKMQLLETGIDLHLSKGDQTTDVYTNIYIPFWQGRIGLDVKVIPLEYYSMDTATRDRRRVREKDGKGFCSGDFHIGTWIQVCKNMKYLPDILLTINLKTASGTQLEAARYTDTPGYFFDCSIGRKFLSKSSTGAGYRIYGMAGFYSYQTFDKNSRQNDTFLYGAGVDYFMNNLTLQNQVGGYHGYLGIGDSPLVYRMVIRNTSSDPVSFNFQLQQGLLDWKYTSLRFSASLNIEKIARKIIGKNEYPWWFKPED
ncbi:MAG: hypothetical protein FJY10_07875 [Bacteroidetes bacterium]|nr:hypothetical protein [Bacteroidota bacterium]